MAGLINGIDLQFYGEKMGIFKLIITALFGNLKYKKQEKYFERLRANDEIIEFKDYK